MANTVKSRKQKGRLAQQYVRDKVIEYNPELTLNDVRSVPASVNGPDLMLSEKAMEIFPFNTEVKNRESLNIWQSLKQAEDNSEDLTPLLVFKRNRSEYYCALKFEDFMRLVSEYKERNKCNDRV